MRKEEEMTLDEFLFDSGLKLYELAEKIPCSTAHLSSVKSGKTNPSKRLIYVIEKITNGRVKLKRKE